MVKANPFILMALTMALSGVGLRGEAQNGQGCHASFQESILTVSSEQLGQLIDKPGLYLNQKVETQSRRKVGTPFRVILRSALPPELQQAVEDIQILSTRPPIREKVFGNAQKMGQYRTLLLTNFLGLSEQRDNVRGLFVEVGVEVFVLDNGELRIVYSSSNLGNGIDVAHGFLTSLITEIKQSRRTILRGYSFHTHPSFLVPSIEDKMHFSDELKMVKAHHPDINLSDWRIFTTLESGPYLAEVEATDWSE